MSSSGMLVLATCVFLLLTVGMSALSDFGANVNDTNPVIKADANLGTDVANPLFTVLMYACLGIIAIALLRSFESWEVVLMSIRDKITHYLKSEEDALVIGYLDIISFSSSLCFSLLHSVSCLIRLSCIFTMLRLISIMIRMSNIKLYHKKFYIVSIPY
jgi:hypothetical protein